MGHFSRECPKPRDWSRVQCQQCQQFGHTVARCKNPPAESSSVPNGEIGADTTATGGWNDSGVDTGTSGGGWNDAPATADNDMGGWQSV